MYKGKTDSCIDFSVDNIVNLDDYSIVYRYDFVQLSVRCDL